MQVEKAHAPATAAHNGHTYWFCSDRCHGKFTADPDRYTRDPRSEPMAAHTHADAAVDPVCGMDVDPENPGGGTFTHKGAEYAFCSTGCRDAFAAQPQQYAGGSGS
jgi:YHS domain-containing protein